MQKPASEGRRVVARNKKALHEYDVLDRLETGLVLSGPEVKSIRSGKVSLAGSYARVERGEVWLYDMHVSPYDPAAQWNLDPLRPRKLLLKSREIRRLSGGVVERGLTLVPLDVYFRRGYAKVTLALARGRRLHDRREALKRRDAAREMQRGADRDG